MLHLSWKTTLFLIEIYKREFTPIEVSKEFGVSNETIINRLSNLVKNGFVVPNITKERVRSCKLSDFTRESEGEIKNSETKRDGMYLNSV